MGTIGSRFFLVQTQTRDWSCVHAPGEEEEPPSVGNHGSRRDFNNRQMYQEGLSRWSQHGGDGGRDDVGTARQGSGRCSLRKAGGGGIVPE
jgi:hypothetical protein